MMFFNEKIEIMQQDELDSLIEEPMRYTVKYASENSPFQKVVQDYYDFHECIKNSSPLADPILSG